MVVLVICDLMGAVCRGYAVMVCAFAASILISSGE